MSWHFLLVNPYKQAIMSTRGNAPACARLLEHATILSLFLMTCALFCGQGQKKNERSLGNCLNFRGIQRILGMRCPSPRTALEYLNFKSVKKKKDSYSSKNNKKR